MSELYKSLKKFAKKDKLRFHVPGHNGGKLYSYDFSKNMFNIDVTEFDETDDLSNPDSILKSAQERASKLFGARKTYFLTGGSTIGIQAMILGAFDKGDKIIVDRNCHKSVISALVLGGITPLFVYPHFNPDTAIYSAITASQISDAMEQNPDIRGAVITSPTYYGICSQIKEIADILHSHNKLLLVDEAHGADFVFSDLQPRTALECGADICVQSVHKTLPCLTQTSVLHIGKQSKISIRKFERALRLLHTTSPSYLLMTSIDEGIGIMKKQGKKRIADLYYAIEDLKAKIRIADKIEVIDESKINFNLKKSELRLVLSFKKLGISGFTAAKILKENYGIYAEACDFYNVVFVICVSHTKREIALLEDAIEEISVMNIENHDVLNTVPSIPEIELAYNPSDVFGKEFETLPIFSDELLNRVCSNIYSVCPPGCAILIPGQKINADTLEYIREFTDFKYIDVLE